MNWEEEVVAEARVEEVDDRLREDVAGRALDDIVRRRIEPVAVEWQVPARDRDDLFPAVLRAALEPRGVALDLG